MCPNRRQSARRRRGFTLMEVLLVLLLLAFLGSMTVLGLNGVRARANREAARTQLGAIREAVQYYIVTTNSPPANLDVLSEPTPMPTGGQDRPALEKAPGLDPWGNTYQYQSDGQDYRLWSLGPDHQDGTEDDVNL